MDRPARERRVRGGEAARTGEPAGGRGGETRPAGRVGRAGRVLSLSGVVLALAAACHYDPPPVPVEGGVPDLARLAGEWRGEYGSADTGRSGGIFFRLDAGEDTARGDVLMVPLRRSLAGHAGRSWGEEAGRPPPPEVIPIRFVRVRGSAVTGELAEYRDPDCGCHLRTIFVGELEGDRIEGRFTTSHLDGGAVQTGWWRVRRVEADRAAGETTVAARPADPAEDREAEPDERGPARGEPAAEGIAARDTIPLDGPGLADIDLADRGRALFASRGCDRCHTAGGGVRVGPDLGPVTEHRSFRWIYYMILNPDSMVVNDPTARALYSEFAISMPDGDVSPWEALALYEYLWREAAERPAP